MEISKELSKCLNDLEIIKQKLLDDNYLLQTTFAFDVLNSIDDSQRDACVAQLDRIIQMLKHLSNNVEMIIKYESAWKTPWDSDFKIDL